MPNITQAAVLLAALMTAAAAPAAETPLAQLVRKIQPAVATVIGYDIERNIANLGTGFFINPKGHLVTNFHVLAGRFGADVRTAAGKSYRVEAVIAENREADLLLLRVAIPAAEISWIPIGDRPPALADRVVVVGSPFGLEQTVSEGIISSVREIPPIGEVFQISAPISQGSSGSPVVNAQGQAVGVASFQFLVGQNLNFAVSARQVLDLAPFETPRSISEWTFAHSGRKPRLAEELCQKGFRLSIRGEDLQAVEFFKAATEKDPQDPAAWSGLGSCYAGLNNTEEALSAYRQAIAADPGNEAGYFHLANYLGKVGRHEEAIAAYRDAIRLRPGFEAAHFNLGVLLARLERYEEGRLAFEAVTRINPEAAPAHYNLGIALGQLGRHEEAIAAQRRVIRLKPDFAPAHYAIGESYAQLDQIPRAMQAYRESVRADPDFAPAHLAMGIALVRQGNRAAALEEYKILRTLDTAMAGTLFERIYPENESAPQPKRSAKRRRP